MRIGSDRVEASGWLLLSSFLGTCGSLDLHTTGIGVFASDSQESIARLDIQIIAYNFLCPID